MTKYRLKERISNHKQVILLDAEREIIEQHSDKNPHSGVQFQNLAYIIYTSGSSGRPKGVMVCHANVIELFRMSHSYFSFHDRDIWALFHSYAFGFSVWEIWGALFYGARLVIVPHKVSQNPLAFYKMVCKEGITVLCQTPSAFRLFDNAQIRLGASQSFKIRYIIFSGESLEPYHVASWVARHGDCFPKLVNMYALTETSGAVACKRIRREHIKKGCIGNPFPGIKIYICDENSKNLGNGEIGEIYVGGKTVARGYIARPDLTAAKFIPNRFSHKYGSRLYKTGDIGCYLDNGEIEYKGRIDQQIKIRGFRIELEDVRAVLSQYPKVRDVVLMVREGTERNKRLVAYIVPKSEPIYTKDLRHFLLSKLPIYMIPSDFVKLPELPLTPNSKVDYHTLSQFSALPFSSEHDFRALSLTEETLTEIWSDILGIQVDINENFFDLGGDSMQIIQVYDRLQKDLNCDISKVDLFKYPTISALAKYLDRETCQVPYLQMAHERSKKKLLAIEKRKQKKLK